MKKLDWGFKSQDLTRSHQISPDLTRSHKTIKKSLVHHVNQALKANLIFRKDTDYIVRDGKVQIIDEITIPDADFSVEIPDEGDKYYFSEKSYRKIIWISTIISLILISIFIETITYQPEYLIWGVVAFIFGLIVFIIPIFLPIKDDIETLRKRAEKERIKAWRKGKFEKDNKNSQNNEEDDDLEKTKLPEEKK